MVERISGAAGPLRQRDIVTAAVAGDTLAEIAETCGVGDLGEAWALVEGELAQCPLLSPRAQAALEWLRLEAIWRAIAPRLWAGEPTVVGYALRLLEREADLVGSGPARTGPSAPAAELGAEGAPPSQEERTGVILAVLAEAGVLPAARQGRPAAEEA